MSANASFEESVVALKSMFPDIPELVVRTTLEARDGHVESSVEKLLQMSRRGGGGHTQVGGFDRAPGAIGMSPSSRNGYVLVPRRIGPGVRVSGVSWA